MKGRKGCGAIKIAAIENQRQKEGRTWMQEKTAIE